MSKRTVKTNTGEVTFKTEEKALEFAKANGFDVIKTKNSKRAIKRGLGGYQGQKYTASTGRVRRR